MTTSRFMYRPQKKCMVSNKDYAMLMVKCFFALELGIMVGVGDSHTTEQRGKGKGGISLYLS